MATNRTFTMIKPDAVEANNIGSILAMMTEAGTIRKRFAKSIGENAVHGSDSDENAEIEGNFFFSQLERF